MKTLFLGAAVLVALVVTAGFVAQGSRDGGSLRAQAIGTVRVLNTAESQYFNKVGHYGAVTDLQSSGALKEAEEMFDSSERLPTVDGVSNGFNVHLISCPDNKCYSVSVIEASKPFESGFFSDQRGLIYDGHVLK